MHVEIVVNPVHGRSRRACGRVKALCRAYGATFHVSRTSPVRPGGALTVVPAPPRPRTRMWSLRTSGPESADTTYAEPERGLDAHAPPRTDLVVVIGGDGTLREVAGGLAPASGAVSLPAALRPGTEPPPLLAVPVGTANLFAFSHGVRSPRSALALLREVLVAGGLPHGDAVRPCLSPPNAGVRPSGQGPADPCLTGRERAGTREAALLKPLARGSDLHEARLCGAGPRASGDQTEAHPRWEAVRSDLGWARLTRSDGRRTPPLPFLTDAGMGGSGRAITSTPHGAKRLLGPLGYGLGAVRTLTAPPIQVRLRTVEPPGTLEDSPCPLEGSVGRAGKALVRSETNSVWGVEFGNISMIPGGVTVFPHGSTDTGTLAFLAVRGEEVPQGWPDVFLAGLLGGHLSSPALRCETVTAAAVEAETPAPVHLDGESAGWATALAVRTAPGALRVIRPRPHP
ncbi:diacylglycerol/lipid kinase family protein [Brevibacterium album]|uniref:diacylglycerol/lipid kinase family protein n=1 Tax=Brevibacterium album TaxID=417948 RepID=UPI000409CF3D|nr:diacylglycerol kinase family protein [Brevibacterium album]